MGIHYIHVDSKNRDTPFSNSYVLNLKNPIRGPVKVDLVSARVPNTLYNITVGSNVITYSNGTHESIQPGFYTSQTTISSNFMYVPSQGKYQYTPSNQNVTATLNTDEISRVLGFPSGVPITNNQYSSNVADFSLNEYVFIDIEEFRNPFFNDAKSLPYDGLNADNMFAVIPMDVGPNEVKSFKEFSDYSISVNVPPQNLSRLTIRWYDKNLNLINFQGYENNGFVLRVHTEIKKDDEYPDVRPEEIDLYIESVKKRLEEDEEPKKKKPKKFGRWSVFVAIIGILVYWYLKKKTV
jgi:hypothetical protein